MQSSRYSNCWRSSDAAGLGEFLIAFSRVHRPDPVAETIHQTCSCNKTVFSVTLTGDCTRIQCTACESLFEIIPPGLSWDDSVDAYGVEDWACDDCGSTEFNVAAGKSMLIIPSAANPPIWTNIGVRCCKCNLLTCINDFCWPPMPEHAFDPNWLRELARLFHPELSWLANSLACCTSGTWANACSIRFVDSTNINQPGSTAHYLETIVLEHPRMGSLNVDVLSDHRIGGIEFYDRLFLRQLVR